METFKLFIQTSRRNSPGKLTHKISHCERGAANFLHLVSVSLIVKREPLVSGCQQRAPSGTDTEGLKSVPFYSKCVQVAQLHIHPGSMKHMQHLMPYSRSGDLETSTFWDGQEVPVRIKQLQCSSQGSLSKKVLVFSHYFSSICVRSSCLMHWRIEKRLVAIDFLAFI